MRFCILLSNAAYCIATVSAAITYTFDRASVPTQDQLEAYKNIQDALDAAIARYNRLAPEITIHLSVSYVPGVPTAEGGNKGIVRFGANRAYQREWNALHEISHCLGVGLSYGWRVNWNSNGNMQWPYANAVLKIFDGPNARLERSGEHFHPYGMNFQSEFSDVNADRHVQIIKAMKKDGM